MCVGLLWNVHCVATIVLLNKIVKYLKRGYNSRAVSRANLTSGRGYIFTEIFPLVSPFAFCITHQCKTSKHALMAK